MNTTSKCLVVYKNITIEQRCCPNETILIVAVFAGAPMAALLAAEAYISEQTDKFDYDMEEVPQFEITK